MPEHTLTCGQLAMLLPHSAYGKDRSFIDHNPVDQRFWDEEHCDCTPGSNSEWWAENPYEPQRCRHMTALVDARFPGLRLRLCCECRDRWTGSTAALFDAVAEVETEASNSTFRGEPIGSHNENRTAGS